MVKQYNMKIGNEKNISLTHTKLSVCIPLICPLQLRDLSAVCGTPSSNGNTLLYFQVRQNRGQP